MQVALLLWKHSPESYAELFSADKKGCIQQWFSHFTSTGKSDFLFGARALASYAISHREEVIHSQAVLSTAILQPAVQPLLVLS